MKFYRLPPGKRAGTGQERVWIEMKHKSLAALLVLLFMLSIPITASADVIYPAPAPFVTGVEVNHLLATLDPGGSVWTDPELLPPGLHLETEEMEEWVNVYLRGVPTVPGVYNLLFAYNDVYSLCIITVLPGREPLPQPVALSVEQLPLVTSYTEGDLLDPEGLSLLVELSDSSSYLVSDGYELDPTLLDEVGTQSIQVSYEGLTCSFDVDVAPVSEEILSIGVQSLPLKVVYNVGEELDPSGLLIRVYTDKGVRDQFTELLCFPTTLNEPGEQEITVWYKDQSCVFNVRVLAKDTAPSLAVYQLPYKTAYQVGEKLDPDGLVLIETGSGEPRYLDSGFRCHPTSFTEPGPVEVVVRHGKMSCTFPVTVFSPPIVPDSPEIAPEPTDSQAEPDPQPEETPEPSPVPESSPTPEPELPPDPEVSPEASPEATPEPEPQPEETPEPAIVPAEPPAPSRSSPELPSSGKQVVAVTGIAALGALAVLGVYLFLINRNGREFFRDFRDSFRRKR